MSGRGPMVHLAGWVFVLGCLAWMLWVPYSPRRLLRAMPAHSRLITSHDALGERWAELRRNPLVAALTETAEGGPGAGVPPDAVRMVRKAAQQRVLFASVEALGPFGEPAWVGASWVGARGHVARWWLRWAQPAGMERHEPAAGRYYWTVAAPPASDRVIAFTLEDGILVACWARHRETIQEVLAMLDGRAPSLERVGAVGPSPAWLFGTVPPDRAWIRGGKYVGGNGSQPLKVELTECDTNALRGVVSWPVRAALPTAFASTGSHGQSVPPWAGRVVGLMHMRRAALDQALVPWAPAAWSDHAAELLDRLNADVAWLGLFGQANGGRLRGLRVPALVAALPVRERERAVRGVAEWLPELSRGAAFSPVLVPLGTGWSGWQRLDDAGGRSAYSRLPNQEKGVVVVRDAWLFLATHRRPLEVLQEQVAGGTEPTRPRPGDWVDLPATPAAICAGWLDLQQGGKAVRNGLAVWSLALLGGDPSPAASSHNRTLRTLRDLLEAAEPMGRLTWTARLVGDAVALDINLSPYGG